MTGLVSTIIPVFNRPTMLREAVQSVLDQTYRPIEIVIVDDGSTDNTPEVIRELELSSPGLIRSIRQANFGPGAAREAGRVAAHGEFVQYLDSDDLLLSGKFELQVAALNAHPEHDIAYGKALFTRIGETPGLEAQRKTGEKHERLFPALLLSRWWPTSTPLFRSSIVDRMGPWQPLWNEEDWEYDARAGALGAKLVFVDEFASVTRSHQADQHLCYRSSSDPKKLRDRAVAHELILGHARTAGITEDQPEMQHFARELFLLSRQCGAAGLDGESKRLFELARLASGGKRGGGVDFRAYKMGALFLGWKPMGRLSVWLDGLRR